jgi:hypothetical protein
MTPLVTLPHILLVLAGAFLVGVRAYAETHPRSAETDENTAQLLKLAKVASAGFVLLMLAVVVGLDLGTFRVAKVIQ